MINNYYTNSLYLSDWCYENPKERDADDEEIIIEEEEGEESDYDYFVSEEFD